MASRIGDGPVGKLLGKTGAESEVADEFGFHVEMPTRELVSKGMDPAQARAVALQRFGDIRRVERECTRIAQGRNRRMQWKSWFSELRQDFHFALRQMPIAGSDIRKRIFWTRGKKVMIDNDLADLYGVSTRILNQQVRRNAERFPNDFMFQLTAKEAEALRSQIVTSKAEQGRGGRAAAPSFSLLTPHLRLDILPMFAYSLAGERIRKREGRFFMTDVLLAHAFFIKNDPKQAEKMKPYPPLGTLYAASMLRQRGHSVALFDAMLSDGEHEFRGLLEKRRPSVVAIYEDQFNFLNKMCLDQARQAAFRMSQAARDAGATVIAAGSDVSDHPQAYLSNGVQYALIGEPEHSFGLLIDHLNNGSNPLEGIAGVAVPDPESPQGYRLASTAEPERHPDAFPFPAWDLIDVERYRQAWTQAHGYFSVNMVSTRGCPFHCNWCAKPIWGQRYAMRSPDNVAQEMALVKKTVRPDHIWFADDIFGLQPRWVAEFARHVEELDASVPFMIQSRVDLMTEKAVEGLARAGCVEVWMGVESGSQKILDAMDKGTKLPKIPLARKRLEKAGIRACFFIQFGYPGETFEDIMKTVQMVRDNMPDDIGISVSYPLPGTKFYDMVQAQLGKKKRWKDSNDLAMMFEGTYQTPFYRKLHRLLHRDLELRQRLQSKPADSNGLLCELDRLNHHWFELGQMENQQRSADPTAIEKDYAPVQRPDLSKRWN